MKRLLVLMNLIALSAQAMEQAEVITVTLKDDISISITPDKHKMLCSLSKTYADIVQDTEKELGNTDVITLDNIVPHSFEFILNYLNELNEIAHPTLVETDIPAFNRLEKAFQKLSKDAQKSVRQVVTYLDLPTRLHPGLPAEIWQMIREYAVAEPSILAKLAPLINALASKIISKDIRTTEGTTEVVTVAPFELDCMSKGKNGKEQERKITLKTDELSCLLENDGPIKVKYAHDPYDGLLFNAPKNIKTLLLTTDHKLIADLDEMNQHCIAWEHSLHITNKGGVERDLSDYDLLWDLNHLKQIKNNVANLSFFDFAILALIQGEIIKDNKGQLKENLCDEAGLNPLRKAKKLGASPALIQLLEETSLFEERKSWFGSYCSIQ